MAWILENSPLSIRKGDAKFFQAQARAHHVYKRLDLKGTHHEKDKFHGYCGLTVR
jgi:hypothetical protein